MARGKSNVARLVPAKVTSRQHIVEALEAILKQARAGELDAILLVKVKCKGGPWCTERVGGALGVLEAVGALEQLKLDLLRDSDPDAC